MYSVSLTIIEFDVSIGNTIKKFYPEAIFRDTLFVGRRGGVYISTRLSYTEYFIPYLFHCTQEVSGWVGKGSKTITNYFSFHGWVGTRGTFKEFHHSFLDALASLDFTLVSK